MKLVRKMGLKISEGDRNIESCLEFLIFANTQVNMSCCSFLRSIKRFLAKVLFHESVNLNV